MAESRPAIAILASGSASRFGGGKLQADLGGKPVAAHAVDAALALGLPIALVVRSNELMLWRERHPDCHILINPAADRGMGTSIRCATQWASSCRAPGMVLLLADMPFVPKCLLTGLVDNVNRGQRTACRYPDNHIGIPAAFPETDFAALAKLADHKGAKHLLATPSTLVLRPHPDALVDIDTKPDLAYAAERFAHRCAA